MYTSYTGTAVASKKKNIPSDVLADDMNICGPPFAIPSKWVLERITNSSEIIDESL